MSFGDEIVFDWRKWPDTPYRSTPMSLLGEDDQGAWLFAPRGAARYAADGPKPLPVSFLTLLPRGGQWWIATWMRDNPEIDIDLHVDIVHPPEWTTGWRWLERLRQSHLDVAPRRWLAIATRLVVRRSRCVSLTSGSASARSVWATR